MHRPAMLLSPSKGNPPRASVDDRNALLRELMAVFDELPAALRDECPRHDRAQAPAQSRTAATTAGSGESQAALAAAAMPSGRPATVNESL